MDPNKDKSGGNYLNNKKCSVQRNVGNIDNIRCHHSKRWKKESLEKGKEFLYSKALEKGMMLEEHEGKVYKLEVWKI
uniref:Uncharacterized protein n=1 Tax=Romanomermis culicivorax TaxID=13658 RepID=A0A915L0R8_ROMCU